jgi:subfamily B ATP-binding cassette protein MsbA
MKEIIQLLKLTLGEKRRLILSLIFTLMAAFFTYVFVNLIQPIMDEMLKLAPKASPDQESLIDVFISIFNVTKEQLMWLLPVLLVVVIFGKGLFTFLSSFFMKSIGFNVVREMRNNLFDKLMYQSSSYFDSSATGELMSRLTNDVDKIQEAVSGSMGDLIREVFILLSLLIYIFITDWKLALFSFVIAPMAVIPLAIFSQKLKKRGKANQVNMARIYNLLYEAITGNKIIKAFTMEKFEMKKFLGATLDYMKSSLKLAWIGSLSSPFMEFMGGVLGAVILIAGTSRIAAGIISPGDFGSFVMAIFLMYTPINRLSRANNVIQQGVACYDRVQDILSHEPQIQDSPQAKPLPTVKGSVKFENVTFQYQEERPVLDGIEFEVLPTEKAALVGLSGAGKTTIINLLSRFYEPSSGRITIDGVDISSVTLSSLRSQIGLVTQELILFNDSVRNNIAYGLTAKSSEEIIDAAKTAMAHDFIINLPGGYDMQIGEKGGLLSSGQRQRLAIARALLKDPPILILDEATSALDSEAERLIQIALKNVMKDRTTFVIAHRLSTIRHVDKIFVVDRGKIVETGKHEELISRGGLYGKLYDLQFPDEEDIL